MLKLSLEKLVSSQANNDDEGVERHGLCTCTRNSHMHVFPDCMKSSHTARQTTCPSNMAVECRHVYYGHGQSNKAQCSIVQQGKHQPPPCFNPPTSPTRSPSFLFLLERCGSRRCCADESHAYHSGCSCHPFKQVPASYLAVAYAQ